MKNLMIIKAGMMGIVTACLLLLCRGAWAIPVEVVLFQKSAQITEVSRVSVHPEGKGQGKITLIVPGQVLPESMKIILPEDPDLKISNILWKSLASKGLAHHDAQQKQLKNLKEEEKRLQASIKGLDAQISFWQSQTKAKTKTLNDAMNLSAAISRNMKKDWQEKLTLEGECEKLEQRIGNLQAELKKGQEIDRSDWEVTLLLAGLKPGKRAVSLKYSYSLSDCGWTPLNRLEALSRQGRVEFSQDAEVWQNTRQDWDGVQLYLANQPVTTLIAPEKLPEWKISIHKAENRKNPGKKEMREATPTPVSVRNPDVPFLRTLGKRSLPSGKKLILPLESASWSATFIRVLRPFSNSVSRVMAVISSPSSVQIPENPSLFLMDGIFLGRQEFGFYGMEKKLFLGTDPTVSAEVKLLSDLGNAPVIDGEKQQWKWHWQTQVKNEGSSAVKIRIEEPVPQIRDRRIKSEVRGEPTFSEEQSIGSRDLELSPGGKQTLETFVHIEAPRELNLEMLWTPGTPPLEFTRAAYPR